MSDLRQAVEALRKQPTEYHYLCWGGSVVVAVDYWSPAETVICRLTGRDDWPNCKTCDGEVPHSGKELRDDDRTYNRALDDVLAVLAAHPSAREEPRREDRLTVLVEQIIATLSKYETTIALARELEKKLDALSRSPAREEPATHHGVTDADEYFRKELREKVKAAIMPLVVDYGADMGDQTNDEMAVEYTDRILALVPEETVRVSIGKDDDGYFVDIDGRKKATIWLGEHGPIVMAALESALSTLPVEGLAERLAEYAHEVWSRWARTVLDSEPGISFERRERWVRLINMPYLQLIESEKVSDRAEAIKIIRVIGGTR